MMKAAGIGLIVSGGFTFLIMVLMAIGGLEVMMGLFLPIGLMFAPVKETLMAWVEIPLAMFLEAQLLDVRSTGLSGFLGSGEIDFRVTLSGGGYESAPVPVVPALWVEEDAEIDEVTRYVISGGPLNYPSIFFWLVSICSLVGLLVSIIFKFVSRSKSNAADKGTAGMAIPPPNPVQVIGVNETTFNKE